MRSSAVGAAGLMALFGAATFAAAQDRGGGDGGVPADDDRFQIERVGEDLLRLDRVSGQVELCVPSLPRYVCRTVVEAPPTPQTPDAPASSALLAENETLKADVAELKRRLSMIAALVRDVEKTTPGIPSAAGGLAADARRDIDEALDVTDYAVRRFRDLFKTLTEDPPQK